MDTKSIKYFSILIAFLAVFGISGTAYSQCVVMNGLNAGAGSLRDCIETQPDAVVNFNPAVTVVNLTQEIIFSSSKTVNGDGVAIGGNGVGRIFSTVDDGTGPFDIILNDMTLTGGNGAGATMTGFGGAAANFGHNMTFNRSNIIFSSASTGGGIAAIEGMTGAGSLTINESTIRNNTKINFGNTSSVPFWTI